MVKAFHAFRNYFNVRPDEYCVRFKKFMLENVMKNNA